MNKLFPYKLLFNYGLLAAFTVTSFSLVLQKQCVEIVSVLKYKNVNRCYTFYILPCVSC